MTDLITKLEKAEEGSRELSDEVLLACGWREVHDGFGYDEWVSPDNRVRKPQAIHVTQSLDAALSLVPSHLCWRYDSALGYAELIDLTKSPCVVGQSSEDPCLGGKNAPLAICLAILRAREAEKE